MVKRLAFSTFPSDSPINDNATPIVFLHGWGLNSGIWQPLLALFSEQCDSKYQLITVDLPGFGVNSDVDITPYTLSNICQEIEQTIKKPAIYLGWSLGGLIATEMAISYPKQVLALITIASSPYFVHQAEENWPGIKENVLNNFHDQLAQDTGKTISGFLKIQAMGSPHIRQDLKLITQLVMAHPLPNEQTLARSLSLLSQCDLRQSLSTIQQPFFRLYGQNDSLVPKAVIEKIDDLAPSSDKYLFEHASHAPFISHIDCFYQILIQWLDTHFSKNMQ